MPSKVNSSLSPWVPRVPLDAVPFISSKTSGRLGVLIASRVQAGASVISCMAADQNSPSPLVDSDRPQKDPATLCPVRPLLLDGLRRGFL